MFNKIKSHLEWFFEERKRRQARGKMIVEDEMNGLNLSKTTSSSPRPAPPPGMKVKQKQKETRGD